MSLAICLRFVVLLIQLQTINNDDIVSTEKTFKPDDNGDYYFVVVNKLNGTEATSVRSEIITVNK